jgi:hypothetical protein
MVASSPARKNITRRTREEMVPRSPFPNNAPAIQRRPKATMTMLMKSSTVRYLQPKWGAGQDSGVNECYRDVSPTTDLSVPTGMR